MTAIVSTSSACTTLFRPWFGLVDHSIAWCRFHDGPFLSSRRFSAWFGGSSRRSQLRKKFGHGPSHLLRRSFALAALPGTQTGLHQWTRQHQVIVHNGDDLTPAFKLRWGAQPGLCPQQALFVEAIAMLVRVAPSVAQTHLWHTGLRLAIPQKPTLAWVARPISGPMTQDTDDRHLEVACLGQMQPRPPGDLDGMTFRIAALPPAIGLSIRAGITTLKTLPIFARRSTFTRVRGRRAVQHPLAFKPQQFVERQSLGGQQKRCTTVPAIAGHDRTTIQQRSQLTQLSRCHLDAGLGRSDEILIKHHCPTTGLLR